MKTILLEAIVLALISFPMSGSAGETVTGVVKLHSGPIRGTVEDGVRAYAPHALMAKCRCTRHRVETVLRALTPDEIADMKVDGKITVTCEFCSAVYDFDDAAIDALVPG